MIAGGTKLFHHRTRIFALFLKHCIRLLKVLKDLNN